MPSGVYIRTEEQKERCRKIGFQKGHKSGKKILMPVITHKFLKKDNLHLIKEKNSQRIIDIGIGKEIK